MSRREIGMWIYQNAGGDKIQNKIISLLNEREINVIPNINLPDQIEKAKLQGFEGEPCPECQNFTLVRNGTCLKCNTCGATTGCS